jgi:16S rRNA (cytosine967-C5)-methyltransferase
MAITGREAANQILRLANPAKGPIAPILDKYMAQTLQKPQCKDLVLGTLRHRGLIDRIIQAFADCPVKRISHTVLTILRPAVYELVFCPLTPVYALVNEAVSLARTNTGRKQSGFVNAVLRSIDRHVKVRHTDSWASQIKAAAPGDQGFGCVFNQDFLPDPDKEPVAYVSQAYSLPAWLIKSWHETHGFVRTQTLAQASNRKPSLYLRANPLKTSVQDLALALQEQGLEAECHQGLVRVQGAGDPTQLPGFDRGWFVVQDMAAYHVVTTLDPKPGWHILDLCAAPGTKTTHLAEHTGNRARIVATDIQPDRLVRLRENMDRLGHTSIEIIEFSDVAFHVRDHGPFDAILLDVPCSNTGVIAKRPELRYRLQPRDIESLYVIQKDLLSRSLDWLAPQGTLCYSTCSIESQENQAQIETFLASHPEVTLTIQHTTFPTAKRPDHDGSFVAVMQRR